MDRRPTKPETDTRPPAQAEENTVVDPVPSVVEPIRVPTLVVVDAPAIDEPEAEEPVAAPLLDVRNEIRKDPLRIPPFRRSI